MSTLASKSRSARAAFRACTALGALLLVTSGVIMALSAFDAGTMAPGFRTPILAFEFAESAAEVEALFGPAGSAERARIVASMDRLNAADYWFLLVYGGTLAAFGVALRRTGVRSGLAVAGLAAFAACMDAIENVALFRITGSLGGDYEGALDVLAVTTWSKWGALAVAFALFAVPFARRGGVWWIAAVAFALPLPLAVGAWFLRGAFAEALSGALALSFIAAFVIAAREGRRPA